MNQLPQLITFDGEARSGKGTVVGQVKDYLRDECGRRVMLIDAGQVFRVLVVAGTRAGIDVDDPAAIDAFLADDANAEAAVRLVKDVYHMSKSERDGLLYTNQVGANSAKFGARPLSQQFKDDLLKKWLRDARNEGYDTVLLDGRALTEVGQMLADDGLCEFTLGFYFVCDPIVGARRTLGYAATPYNELTDEKCAEVDELVEQIHIRNQKDRERDVQPIIPPVGAPTWRLPCPAPKTPTTPPMYVVDTSAEMTKAQMSDGPAQLVAHQLLL